ncbi:putative quinol monooxygenase [Roseisalinus antarcticus]|uniref:Putative monooxygenase n=1 Tax=Roseisalinus antarcticus TaxID=254357 RepID=A0A1Y5SXR1_9RHOB|nr:putative quinol monooxygenase [Roseisalinus antarcticus]SLN47533.1 Putative monooxygenase [Roseisalinus antarcticus]
MSLTIVASFQAHPGKGDALQEVLRGLIAPTLAEDGCVQYDLHRNNSDPDHFLFYETWETRPLWRDHAASDHIAAFGALKDELVAEMVVHEMSRVD